VQEIQVEEMNALLKGEKPFTVHPAAELFPLVEGEDFESLVNSIREHGIQTPVMFGWGDDEKPVLLDGRNRLRAVERLKEQGITVTVPVRSFDYSDDGITEVEWIESQNFDRRHLTDDQRVMIAAALHPMIEAEAREAQKASQFDAEKAKAAAAKRHDKTATADSPSPQKRDRKKSEARTTAAKLAKKTKTSTHKAKQAIALNKAVESGAVSADVQQAVMKGKKKLKEALPAKPSKSKPQPAADPAAAFRAEIVKAWEGIKKKIAVADHRELRKVLAGIIREEQKQFDK
jgi:ParB-like chromosome segregation protein Spo0J